jgi:hypothetical protein
MTKGRWPYLLGGVLACYCGALAGSAQGQEPPKTCEPPSVLNQATGKCEFWIKPVPKAECTKPSMVWDDNLNICSGTDVTKTECEIRKKEYARDYPNVYFDWKNGRCLETVTNHS